MQMYYCGNHAARISENILLLVDASRRYLSYVQREHLERSNGYKTFSVI